MKNKILALKNKRQQDKKKMAVTHCIIFLCLALILEIFVFNYRYWQSRNYEPIEISPAITDESITQDGDLYTFSEDDSGIYFSYFDVEIHNIYIDVENVLEHELDDYEGDNRKAAEFVYGMAKAVPIEIFVTDEGNSYGLTMPQRMIVSNIEQTKYIHLHLAGNSTYIRVGFPSASDTTKRLNKVILNANVPLFFSIWRFLFVFVVLMLCYLLRPSSSLYDIRLDLKKTGQKVLIAAVIALQIAFSMGMASTDTRQVNVTSDNADYMSLTIEKRYILLADALLQGHVYVDYDPGVPIEDIEALDNPYDYVQLSVAGTEWNDYAYYNGKYYVYFGVVPCLLFNIPVKLLTGKDIMSYPCIMALIPFVVISAFALIYVLIQRYCKNRKGTFPLVTYLLLSLIFINSMSLSCLYALPDAYYLPIFTAMFFVLLGLTLWISAVRTDGTKQTLSGWRLCLGSLCMALTGGCRPQFLIAIFLAVPFFWNSVFKDRTLLSVKDRKALRNTLLFTLPIILVAAGLGWYNYARFGSIFDFGANYNQTTNDMTVRGFQLYRVFQGIFYYILQMPTITETFPYVAEVTKNSSYMGTTTILDQLGGILWLQPAIWSVLLIKSVKQDLKEKKIWPVLLMLLAFTLIVPSVDSVMAGIVNRYHLDFYWMAALASVIILAFAYNRFEGSPHGATLKWCLLLILMVTLVITVLTTLQVGEGVVRYYNPTFFYRLQSLIEFWF